ncbi:MAG: asparaginase domain-containing protein, partial [Clostridia bacterium]|nr:asparaginase domain-containing protein [Clostridia bacterium]
SLSTGSRKMLIDKYRESTGEKIGFDVLTPINILSENVQPQNLQDLYDCVKGVDTTKYDGVIITHGTDTLCFTVNWFSQVLCDYPLPIVFVSALYPLTDKRSNGLSNFKGAVDFIEKSGLRGVYCSFTNDGENCKIHLASRLIYPDEINGFYHSALNAHFAEVTEKGIVYNSSPLLPALNEVKANAPAPIAPALSSKVMLITMRSLLDFSVYNFENRKPEAVIIELSHSGTVCTEGGELNFKHFAAYCKEHGVPVIIGPVMSRAGVYASMSTLPDGVAVAYDLTVEMTIVKVMAALGAHLPPSAYLDKCLAHEKIPFPVKEN